MSVKKLTVKQEKFSQLVVTLGNQSEAYRQAYDVSPTIKNETCQNNAYKLLQNNDVATRVEELRNKTKTKHNITRDKMVQYNLNMMEAWEELWTLAKKSDKTKEEVQRFYLCKELVKGSDYKSCAAEISKLTGLYEPEKREYKDTSHSTQWG